MPLMPPPTPKMVWLLATTSSDSNQRSRFDLFKHNLNYLCVDRVGQFERVEISY